MSCGCGGNRLPNSIQVRMQIAGLVAGSGGPSSVRTMADELLKFVCNDDIAATMEALDKPSGNVTFLELADPESVRTRNQAINSPLMVMRVLREHHVEALEAIGITTIGQLVQHDFYAVDGVPAPAVAAALERLVSPLVSMGLSLNMTGEQVRDWILGEPHGQEADK